MPPDIKIIHSSIDDNILTTEFTSGETAFYLEYNINKEDFKEISIASQGEEFYFRYSWETLTLEMQNLIDETVSEILD